MYIGFLCTKDVVIVVICRKVYQESIYLCCFIKVRTSQEIAFFEALCPLPDEAHPLISGTFYEGRLRWRRLPLPCPLVAPRRVRTDPKIMDVQVYIPFFAPYYVNRIGVERAKKHFSLNVCF